MDREREEFLERTLEHEAHKLHLRYKRANKQAAFLHALKEVVHENRRKNTIQAIAYKKPVQMDMFV